MLSQLDKFLQKSNNQTITQTRIIISLTVLGVILFIIAAAFLPFKDQLFNLFYPKPASKADDGNSLTIDGINAANRLATLDGYNFTWDAGSIGLTDGAYAVLFVTTKDDSGKILDRHWLVGSMATEGLNYSGSYTFPFAGTAVVTAWETNKVDCNGFYCNPSLAVHNSAPFSVPRIIASAEPTPSSTLTSTPAPTPTPTLPPTQNFGSISGTVYSSSGSIIAGAKITTFINNSKKTYYSNSAGVYSIDQLSPGTYTLSFQAKNYANKSISVTVTSGSTASGNITLTKRS